MNMIVFIIGDGDALQHKLYMVDITQSFEPGKSDHLSKSGQSSTQQHKDVVAKTGKVFPMVTWCQPLC